MTKRAWTQDDMGSILIRARERGLTAVGIHLSGIAELRAPRDTGRLAGSITWATNGKKNQVRTPAKTEDDVSMPNNDMTLHVGTNVEYAIYMEYGTVKTNKQPYLRPTLDAERKRVVKMYAEQLAKGLQQGK
jgi:HK97 gp10 family phage protein